MFHRIKFFQIEEFTLQQTEEILNHSIIKAIALAAHALANALRFQHLLVLLVLVLPALVGMEDEIGTARYGFKGVFQHLRHHGQHGTVIDCVADNVAAIQIENGRKIDFLPKQAELRHVRNPLLVGLWGFKAAFQQVGCGFTHLTLVRFVFLHAYAADDAVQTHQPLDSLVVDDAALLMKFQRDAAVAHTAFILGINPLYF